MSYILDALKKAEQGRTEGKAPALFAVQAADVDVNDVRKSVWPWIVGVTLMCSGSAGFIAYWLLNDKAPARRAVIAFRRRSRNRLSLRRPYKASHLRRLHR